jgi:hypothetical protein
MSVSQTMHRVAIAAARKRHRFAAAAGFRLGMRCGFLALCFFAQGGMPCSVPEAARAASIVLPLQGDPFEGELVSIDREGKLSFRSAGAASPRTLALDELVRWGHPQSPQPQPLVVLRDGSRVVAGAAWAGAAPLQLIGDKLAIKTALVGEADVPRSLVQGIVFAERSHPDDRLRLEAQVRAAPGDSDEVLLTNNDRLSGQIRELAGGALSLSTAGGELKLPLSRVAAVAFAGRPAGGVKKAPIMAALADGSLLYAASIVGNETELVVELASGPRLTGGRIGDVAGLQLLQSARFAYLSEMEPTDYRFVPYLSIDWPYRRDHSAIGRPLTAGSKRYTKGLGMHSASRLTFRLDPSAQWQRFDASLALDGSAGKRGSVTFGVYVLRDGQWRQAYASPVIRGGERPVDISVDVRGAAGLALTVDYADRGDEMDRANWLDARLVK